MMSEYFNSALLAVTIIALPVGLSACGDQNGDQSHAAARESGASIARSDAGTSSEEPDANPDTVKSAPDVDSEATPAGDNDSNGANVEIPVGWKYTPYQIQKSADEKIFETLIGYKPNLDITFTNQDGKEVNLATSYPGKTLIISTIYTSCPIPDMCPRLTSDFAWLQKNIPRAVRDKVQFLLVSFDPQRDTPEVLKAFGQSHGIKFDNTDLLRGTIDETKKLLDRELQIPLEVNPTTNMIITHAMLLHVVNKDGYIVVERTVNTSEPMEQIAREIALAVQKPFIPKPNTNGTESNDSYSESSGG